MVMEEQQSDIELDSERVPVPQVQKSVEDPHVGTVNKVTGVARGKPRLRKKALHAAILKQMEFYFSDANLNKDRFLNNLIKEDPYVDLSVFLRFNKIRELTTDINRINKALQLSAMLSLSKDGLKVRRVTPVVIKENMDECTLYVQNLPLDADHETLSQIFSQYGPVVYVSVPRYKSNRKIKGFAFVEYDSPESAKKCLKVFQKKGCVLPSHTAPNELVSIRTFDDEEKDVTKGMLKNDNKRLGEDADESEMNEEVENSVGENDTESNENKEVEKDVATNDTESNENKEVEKDVATNDTESNGNKEVEENIATNDTESNESKDKKKAKKRKHKKSESSEAVDGENHVDNEVIKNKKKKSRHSSDISNDEAEQNSEKLNNTPAEGTPKKSSKLKKSVSINEEQMLDNCDENEKMMTEDSANDTAEEVGNANEKKKKRKRKKRSKMEDVSYSLGLQVMAKKDWKYLRNKYLDLQKSKLKQLKQYLRKTRWNQWSNYEKHKSEKEENDEKEKPSKQDNASSSCRFSFTPGVIVKIEMDKPCTDPKSFKMELKGNNSLKYIDIEEGSCFAFVRCDTVEAAQTFAQKSDEERHMTVLEGEEEKLYWNKILQDREQKLGNKIRVKQRGRNKLLKKAEKELGKHIKFDEV